MLLVGLVWLARAGAEDIVEVPIGPDGVQRATITMDSYSFTPNHLAVRAGKPVELTLTSITTVTPHNFVFSDPNSGLRVEATVGPGQTGKVGFTVMQPGTYPFYCDKKLLFFKSHREKGMEGRLDVR